MYRFATTRALRALLIVCAVSAAALAGAGPASAAGVTERVSVASGGGQANSSSNYAAVSADGRHVAFASDASNLVEGDTNSATDIFVRDRQSGTTQRVSVTSADQQANGSSWTAPAISADGRYVAFTSDASNLVNDDTNNTPDIFVRDLETGTTERVSVTSAGEQANGLSAEVAISADGRHVAFSALASNLVGGDTNGRADVFVHDRETGTTGRVSVADGGGQADSDSVEVAIGADGRHVAFSSYASNLVAGDTNGVPDVFVHDREDGSTERVSVAGGGAQSNGPSAEPAMSADGAEVVFNSSASNLVDGDSNGAPDVFLRDRQGGTTESISMAAGAYQLHEASFEPAISADGRHVAFSSWASNLVPGDTSDQDVFVYGRQTGATELISVGTGGEPANSISYVPVISADGGQVAFASDASNLVAGDTNDTTDIFVRERSSAAAATCSDGLDNDGDGLTDFPADGGCASAQDASEAPKNACSDGIDNDGDGHTDHPADPGCKSPSDNNETNARCNDGLDNDGDGQTDYPADPGCKSPADNNETNPQCNDGLDNDGDGQTDHPNDPGCKSPTDNREREAPMLSGGLGGVAALRLGAA